MYEGYRPHQISIYRLEHNTTSTLGTIVIDGTILGTTLELPYRNNMRSISCIPPGMYEVIVREDWSGYEGYGYTYQIINVHNRTHILFHPANWVHELEGCIAVGQYPGKLSPYPDKRAVLNSGNTFMQMKKMTGRREDRLPVGFLTIIDLYMLR